MKVHDDLSLKSFSSLARPVRLAYQPPVSSNFLSEQTSHQQPANSTFLSEQISTSHQPPAKRTGWLSLLLLPQICMSLRGFP
jgi:hypothetical protein